MTRDFDLIRKLLVFFDEKPGPEMIQSDDIHLGDEYTKSQIQNHLILLYQAGFLVCEPEKSSTSDRVIKVYPFDLTWDGHEFLAKIRSETVWQKIKTSITSKGGTLGFTVINQLATKAALQAVGLTEP